MFPRIRALRFVPGTYPAQHMASPGIRAAMGWDHDVRLGGSCGSCGSFLDPVVAEQLSTFRPILSGSSCSRSFVSLFVSPMLSTDGRRQARYDGPATTTGSTGCSQSTRHERNCRSHNDAPVVLRGQIVFLFSSVIRWRMSR